MGVGGEGELERNMDETAEVGQERPGVRLTGLLRSREKTTLRTLWRRGAQGFAASTPEAPAFTWTV